MEKLKLCPFCGGEAESDFGFDHTNKTYFYVNCLQCGAETNHFKTKAEAITAWNTRADSWIPVSERLPKDEEQVIATDGKVWYKMRMFGGRLSFSGSHSFDNAVTHWQPAGSQ